MAVGVFEWSSTSRFVELSDELDEHYVQGSVAGRLTLTAPEVFAYVERLNDAMTLIAKAPEPVPDDRWDGTTTITHHRRPAVGAPGDAQHVRPATTVLARAHPRRPRRHSPQQDHWRQPPLRRWPPPAITSPWP